MKAFTTTAYYDRFVRPFCDTDAGITAGQSEIKRFANGEMQARVQSDVDGEDCLVIGSAAPPDEQLLALITLAHTLKRSGARRVKAFLPYLGYGRQDKFGPGESRGIALIGTLLRAGGVDELITFDVHSELDKRLIGLPLHSLSPAPLFAAVLAKHGWASATIVAPDEGAMPRARALAHVLGVIRPVAHLVKRHVDGIAHLKLVGNVSSQAVLVDDIMDSGHTLISACKILHQQGVQDIAVVVTHGLFTTTDWKQLFELGVKALFVSDSCQQTVEQEHARLGVVPLAPLLAEAALNVTRKEKQHESAIA